MDAYIREEKQERRKDANGIRDFFIGAVAFVEFICAVLGAAYFETTDDPKWLLITLAVMSATIVGLVIMNIREEDR